MSIDSNAADMGPVQDYRLGQGTSSGLQVRTWDLLRTTGYDMGPVQDYRLGHGTSSGLQVMTWDQFRTTG